MDKSYHNKTPMVVRSLEIEKDPFRPQDIGEKILGLRFHSPLVGFGELNDNTIKGLTSLLSVEQLVPERLVFAEQHRLELVRAVEHVASQHEQTFDQFNWEPSC